MAIKPITVEQEYEKNPDITPEDIRNFREWLNTQPHLPGNLLTDVDLLITYHCCEKSMEVSKQVLDLHYTLRTLFAPYFTDRTYNKDVEFSLQTALFYKMPVFTAEGYRILYLRLLDYNPKSFFFENLATTFMMIYDLWQYAEGSWPGVVIIIDMDKAVLGHISRIDLMALKKLLYFIQECMIIKLKEVIFMNAPSFMDKLMMMLKPFLNKPLLDIIRIQTIGSDKIYQTVPKKYFPIEFGGEFTDKNTITEETRNLLKSNLDFFVMEGKKRVNERLRKGKPSSAESVFGIQGSFKKLDID